MKAAVSRIGDTAELSTALRANLYDWQAYREAKVIFAFHPLRSEPDWLGGTLPPNKEWAFPRVRGNDLAFHSTTTLADLCQGEMGVKEPTTSEATEAPDLVLVPGMAFDLTGARLGRGGGYYDRWLASVSPQCVSLAIAFDCQVIAAVPVEQHDQRVDYILTPSGIFPCNR